MRETGTSRAILAAAAVLVMIALLAAGCSDPVSGGARAGEGAVRLEFSPSGLTQSLIAPDVEMQVASYAVTLTPQESGLDPISGGTDQSTLLIEEVPFGLWDIAVSASNADGIPIAEGYAGGVTVEVRETTNVAITVRPIGGSGSFTMSIRWPGAPLTGPSVEAELVTDQGAELPLPWVMNAVGREATTSEADLANGYYLLVGRLYERGQLVMGRMEAVRILTGHQTSGEWIFDPVNRPEGSVEIVITPDLQQPLELSLSGVPAAISEGAAVTANTAVTNYGGAVGYVWYLNGQWLEEESGSVVSLSGLEPGHYQLDAAAFTTDGKRAGSAGAFFSVERPAARSLVSWGNNDQGQVSGTPSGTGFIAMAAGEAHSVALRGDGSLVSWGNNTSNQVSETPGGTGFIAVTAGGYHSAAIRR